MHESSVTNHLEPQGSKVQAVAKRNDRAGSTASAASRIAAPRRRAAILLGAVWRRAAPRKRQPRAERLPDRWLSITARPLRGRSHRSGGTTKVCAATATVARALATPSANLIIPARTAARGRHSPGARSGSRPVPPTCRSRRTRRKRPGRAGPSVSSVRETPPLRDRAADQRPGDGYGLAHVRLTRTSASALAREVHSPPIMIRSGGPWSESSRCGDAPADLDAPTISSMRSLR